MALSIAPLLCKSLTLEERCELAASGLTALDLFSMQAAARCKRMGLPTGSCFMAGQTTSNLQSCSLAAMLITLTKDETMSPWKHGEVRLTELSIEQYFGQLRSQSNNAQLSPRGYFQAASRVALKAFKDLKGPIPKPGDPPLSEEQQLCS